MLTRRELIKTGAAGTALLALGGCAPTSDHRALLGAIADAILDGALPAQNPQRADAVWRAVRGVHAAISGLPPAVQSEVAQLFGLLEFPLTRRVVAGVGPWSSLSRAQVDGFLERWRTSNATLLRSGYQALHQLTMAGWYGADATWVAIGYPGPPRIV